MPLAVLRCCRWKGCDVTFAGLAVEEIQQHMHQHLILQQSAEEASCLWAECGEYEATKVGRDPVTLSKHFESHMFPKFFFTELDLRFCFECREWLYDERSWNKHCSQHLEDLDMFCGIAH